LDTWESRSEIPSEFLDLVLEKDGVDQLDQSMKTEEVLHKVKEDKNFLHAVKKKDG